MIEVNLKLIIYKIHRLNLNLYKLVNFQLSNHLFLKLEIHMILLYQLSMIWYYSTILPLKFNLFLCIHILLL